MSKVLLIGNPNVGKSTLFNSLTKATEHTGNFHGVTVEEKAKKVKFKGQEYEFIDLPGLYSLHTFTEEENVAKRLVTAGQASRIILCDANSIRRNLYLCLQLNELGLDYNILINNYDYFTRHGNKINAEKLSKKLNHNIKIINAKKIKLNDEIIDFINNDKIHQKYYKLDKINNSHINNNILSFKNIIKKNNYQDVNYLLPFIDRVKERFNIDENKIIKAFNNIYEGLDDEQIKYISSLEEEIISARYKYIDNLLIDTLELKKDYIYGASKFDKFLLNPFIMTIGFSLFFLLSIYMIFFLVGPFISKGLNLVLNFILINPFMSLLYAVTDNVWLLEFVSNGVFSSFSTVISFLPQVCLLFVFLTILEDSGIIARLAYVFDDFLSKLGLNGKAIYIMLLGLGCNTMSSMASKNMNGKNLKIKTAIINPFISCMARLPVFVLVASAFFGAKSYFVISGLYLLGLVVALVVALILNKTILPTVSSELLIEFPPLRHIDIKHVLSVAKVNAVDFFKRVFGVILSVGVIVWILSHTTFTMAYTSTITDSILFVLANGISWIFTPIGLNNAGIVSALIVGIMAKELILSTMSITNNTLTNSALITSLTCATSVIHFSMPSAVSFLVFSLLYAPCISTLAVIKKETGTFYMWFTLIGEFIIAYMLSLLVYQTLIHGLVFALIMLGVIALILFAIVFIIKKCKHKKISCLFCNKCKR